MRRALAAVAVGQFCLIPVLGGCGGDDGPSGPITARITHYDYTFDVDTRAAHAIVTAEVDVGGDCLTLPFRGAELKAETLLIDGEPMKGAALNAGTLEMCGSGYAAGETLQIETDQTIPLQTLSTSQVGYSVTNDREQNPFYYLVSWLGGCDQFGPCDNRADQFATYTFHVTHPAGFTARCPGQITEVSGTETECDFEYEGGPTYSTFGVAVYPAWTQRDKGSWGSVGVTLYDRDSTKIDAAIDTAYSAGYVAFMESTFGPFPYGTELRVLTAPTYWSGFEHPGNIVLDDALALGSNASYLVAHVLHHEITHQWAGDQTTLADTYDFVWKESMAEYLSYVYEDTHKPADGLTTVTGWKNGARGAGYFSVPEEKPALFDYYGDVYSPGPMILFRQLEALTSRDQVIAALQSVLGAPRALSVDELIAALEGSTGLDLAGYAAAWIHGSGAPVWPEVTATFDANTNTLAVQQTLAPERTCKFHVALLGDNGERQDVEVDTFRNGTDQTLPVPAPAFAVTSTSLDPDRECLVFPTGTSNKPAPRVPRPWLSPGRDAPLAR